MIEIINNFFTEEEYNLIYLECSRCAWEFNAISKLVIPEKPTFWFKDIFHTKAKDIFYEKIKKGINHNIVIDRLYVNGQARGQSGWWHTDAVPPGVNCFTVVYFPQEWKPEYGGHLMLKSDPITSILPEYNKAVLFDSMIEHMAMEPTCYCITQRESIACKFKVLV